MENNQVKYKPAYRKILFIPYDKNFQSEKVSKNVARLVRDAWTVEKKRQMLNSFGLNGGSDSICYAKDEDLRLRDEGISSVLDFPRVFSKGDINFDFRLCISICNQEFSTKIWSRVHLHFDSDSNEYPFYTNSQLLKYQPTLKDIVVKMNQWGYDLYKDVVSKLNNNIKTTKGGEFNLFALGVNDSRIYDLQEKIQNRGNNLKILKESKSIKEYSSHWNNYYLSDVLVNKVVKPTNKHFWFYSPTRVLYDKYIQERLVFYNYKYKKHNNIPQINLSGIGFDNLQQDYLTYRSSHRVSRFFGSKI